MNDQIHEFSRILPPELLQRAYQSRHELAWARKTQSKRSAALKCRIYAARRRSLDTVIAWPHDDGRFRDSQDRSIPDKPRTAQDFVKNFTWGRYDVSLKGREPFFNLTVDEKRD